MSSRVIDRLVSMYEFDFDRLAARIARTFGLKEVMKDNYGTLFFGVRDIPALGIKSSTELVLPCSTKECQSFITFLTGEEPVSVNPYVLYVDGLPLTMGQGGSYLRMVHLKSPLNHEDLVKLFREARKTFLRKMSKIINDLREWRDTFPQLSSKIEKLIREKFSEKFDDVRIETVRGSDFPSLSVLVKFSKEIQASYGSYRLSGAIEIYVSRLVITINFDPTFSASFRANKSLLSVSRVYSSKSKVSSIPGVRRFDSSDKKSYIILEDQKYILDVLAKVLDLLLDKPATRKRK